MDTDIDHNHIKSTPLNNVSTLWTKLISTELYHVQNNPKLSVHLLNKEIIHLNKIKKLASQANSTQLSASFYYRIVNYIEQNATNDLCRIISFINELGTGHIYMKSTKKAQYYRKLGNDLFKQGQLNESATAYRTGLLHAPNAYFMSSTSENNEFCLEGALLHGNLSAVLARQQLWSSCLESVLNALELHLNVTNIQNCSNNSTVIRLKSRFEQCCKQLNLPMLIEWNRELTSCKLLEIHTKLISLLINENKNSLEKDWYVPTPKYNHNPSYYGLSNGVRIDTNHEKGRHVIATESFEPGDIIAVEPAGGWATHESVHSDDNNSNNNNDDQNTFEYLLLLPSQRMNQCLKCFNQLNSIGFICPYCCDAAYCEFSNNSGCNSYHVNMSNPAYLFQDFQQPVWHIAECRFMFLLNSMGLGHLCFRLAWLRQHYHHLSSDENHDNNHSYFTIDQLIEHFTNFHVDELFEYALTGWLISKILNFNQKINLKSTNNELVQGLWCFDTLRRLQCNAHAITEIQMNYSNSDTWCPSSYQLNTNNMVDLQLIYPFICKLQQIRTATGLFPCVSLFNHSCDPNTIHNFQKSYLILRCLKPIPPGTEIFNCYGPHYLHYPSSVQRVALLQQQYFFVCHCEHCNSKCVQSSSPTSTSLSSLFITDQQSSTVPTNEMLTEWKDAVDKLLQTPWQSIQSIENLKNAIQTVQNVGTLKSTNSWWPSNDNLGSLLDTLGRQYLIKSKLVQRSQSNHTDQQQQSDWLFAQNAGLWCLQQSVQWVKLHYGTISCEYLWELINFLNLSINCFNQFDNSIQLNISEEFTRLNDEFSKLQMDDPIMFTDQNSILSEINKLSTILYGSYKSRIIIDKFVVQVPQIISQKSL